jgi:hypothetical protein
MSASDAAVRAIQLIVGIRDRIELAGRVPGERVEHTRQDDDSTLDDLGVVARLIRKMAEASRVAT